MKRLLLTAAAVGGFLAYREWKRTEQTRQDWKQATDAVQHDKTVQE
ncbi:MAG: DLW-39 family protein [Nesterenkonia sp.]